MAKLKMGRHTSAIKETRKNVKRRAKNAKTKSTIKELIRTVNSAIVSKNLEAAKTAIKSAFSALDKAAKKNIIHKNKADRKKAELAKNLKKLAA